MSSVRLNLRIDAELMTRLEAMAAEMPPLSHPADVPGTYYMGRIGGVSELVRRILYEATGLQQPQDPHERQRAAFRRRKTQ